MARKGSGGRPARYPRGNAISVRPHVELAAVIEARADAVGLSRAEYIEYSLAQKFGMSECAPTPTRDPDDGQEPLIPDPHP